MTLPFGEAACATSATRSITWVLDTRPEMTVASPLRATWMSSFGKSNCNCCSRLAMGCWTIRSYWVRASSRFPWRRLASPFRSRTQPRRVGVRFAPSSSWMIACASAPFLPSTSAFAKRRKSASRRGERRASRPRAASRAAFTSLPSSASASPASAQSRSVPVRGAAAGEVGGVRYVRNAAALSFGRCAVRLHQPSLSQPASSCAWGPPLTNRLSSTAARSYRPTRPSASPSQKPTSRANAAGTPLDRSASHAATASSYRPRA